MPLPPDDTGAANLSTDLREIFGRPTHVIADDPLTRRVLDEELSLYPVAKPSDESRSRIVRVTHRPPPDGGVVNPALHSYLNDGFVARYPNAAVRFRFEGPHLAEVVLHLPEPMRGLREWRSRWRSIQYATPDEMVGQLIHELALVPAVYYEGPMAPLHASAFALPGRGAVLVGGTGGVGKTTMALDLCSRHGAAFAADDIAVLDRAGRVHPNFAYPKIYAYNVHGDQAVRRRVLGDMPLASRLQWAWRERRVGPALVRRRISPSRLYGSVSGDPLSVERYLFLLREHRPSLLVEPIAPAVVAEMSMAVLRAEYDVWHRHLAWDELNALALGAEPRLRLDDRLDQFRSLVEAALRTVDCTLVRVPIGLDHAKLRSELVGVVLGDR